jgi:hypothetical protein
VLLGEEGMSYTWASGPYAFKEKEEEKQNRKIKKDKKI